MAAGPLGTFIHQLRRSLGPKGAEGLSDAELLERWVALRDEAAFEVLVWRHGPLVLGACRRLLAHAQDVEDAFQATFLTLVRRAGSIRRRETVGSWLYRVAYRVALRARMRRAKEAALEKPGLDPPAGEDGQDLLWRDLRPILDEEVNRLPARYRETFIRCYLEGRTNEEAARELGCPVGTVLSRLAWARERLRQRLTRRGVTLTSGVLAGLLSQNAASAAVPAVLIDTTIRASLAFAAGSPAAAGVVSAGAVALAEGVLRAMFMNKLKVAVMVVLTLGIVGTAFGAFALRGPAPAAASAAGAQAPLAAPGPDNAAQEKGLIRVPAQRDGVLLVIGTEVKKGEVVPAQRLVTVKAGDETKQYHRLQEGDTVEEGQLLARIDDRLARDQLAIKEAQLLGARADREGTEKMYIEAKSRYMEIQRLGRGGAVAPGEVSGAKLTMDRYYYEEQSKRQAVVVAEIEVRQAQTILEMYEVRSPARGVIKSILKQRGESVRSLETVFVIKVAAERE